MNLSPIARTGRSVTRLICSTKAGQRFHSWGKTNPNQWNTTKTVLLGVGSAAIKPFTFDKAYQHEKKAFSPEDRKLLYRQEVIRQAVGTALWLGGMLGSWFVSKKIFKQSRDIAHFANAMLGSTFLDTFVRPIITAKLSRCFDSGQEQPKEPFKPVVMGSPIQRHAPSFDDLASGYHPLPYASPVYFSQGPGFYYAPNVSRFSMATRGF